MPQRSDYSHFLDGMRIFFDAFQAETELINVWQSTDELECYANALKDIAPNVPPADAINTFSRIELLSAVQVAHRERDGAFDINAAMQIVNDYFDHINAVLTHTDDGTSETWIDQFQDGLSTDEQDQLVKQMKYGGRRTRGCGAGMQVLRNLAPAAHHLNTIYQRAVLRTDMILAAIAVRRFQITRERFPQTLDELVPVYLSEVPIDIVNDGQPVQFDSNSGGAELSSVGSEEMNDLEDGITILIEQSTSAGPDK